MKFNKLFLGAAILSMGVLASCSSDDEPAVNSGNDVKGEGYITVKFKTAGIGGSRAEGDKYEEGTSAEGEVTAANTRFYFFDGAGNAFKMTDAGNVNTESAIVDNMVIPYEVNKQTTNGNTDITGVLVLGKGTDGYEGVVPTLAVCVSNGTADFMNGLANKSLKELAEAVATSANTSMFMMSNSNYKEVNGNHGAVTIGDKVKSTPEAANGDPVDFYLERLAVKVRIQKNQATEFIAQEATTASGVTTYAPAKYTIYQPDGTAKKDVNLRVQLADWQIVKTVETAYNIKQIPNSDPWTGWNDATYHRSYWATSLAQAKDVKNQYFDIYSDAKWTKINAENFPGYYTWEWTGATGVTAENYRGHDANATSVVVRGYVQEQDGENWKNIELVKWAGTYFTLAAFKQQVINSYYGDNNNAVITADDVTLVYVGGVGGDDNYWEVQINGTKYEKYTHIQYWKNGVTSFYLNIKHGVNDDGANVYGVVRNHIYEYDFTNIVGLGVPGNNPDGSETETFVAAGINILNWKVVSNSVVLE